MTAIEWTHLGEYFLMNSYIQTIPSPSTSQRLHCDFAPGIGPDQCTEQPVRVRPISQWCFFFCVCAVLFRTVDWFSRFGEKKRRPSMENSTKYSTRSQFIAIKQKKNQTSERSQTGREHVRWFILRVPIFFRRCDNMFPFFFSVAIKWVNLFVKLV